MPDLMPSDIQKNRWVDLIEISVSDLIETLEREKRGRRKADDVQSAWLIYARALKSTFARERSDIPELTRSSKDGPFLFLKYLVRIRSLFLRFKTSRRPGLRKHLMRLKKIADGFSDPPCASFWSDLLMAESSFLLSDILHDEENFTDAEVYTLKAAQFYEKIGATRKALRSRLNLAVTRAHLQSDRSHLAEFFSLLQRAKLLQDHVTVSSCYHSIAHEYECIGALRNSLRAIERAIALSFKYHFSSKLSDYLAHKVDLLVKLNERFEAQVCFELLLAVKSEVADRARDYLLERHSFLSIDSRPKNSYELPANYWKDKLNPAEELSPLEERLLALLARGRCTRIELAEALYGDSLPIQSTEARIKNLLFRIRRRHQDLIFFKDGYYGMNPHANLRTSP